MNLKTIVEVEKIAVEFLKRLRLVKKAADGSVWLGNVSPKDKGALRRQSLELTRALAKMRKPGI